MYSQESQIVSSSQSYSLADLFQMIHSIKNILFQLIATNLKFVTHLKYNFMVFLPKLKAQKNFV